MDLLEKSPLLPRPTEDHAILHPCFRYAEVKQALTHITLKLGLVEKPGTNTPYVFLYMASDRYLYIMVSPFRYEGDRLCYGFQYVMPGRPEGTRTRRAGDAYFVSEWHKHPLTLYFDLLKSLPALGPKSETDSAKPWKLLRDDPFYLNELLGEDSVAREFGPEERDLVIALDDNGFEFSSYSEAVSLAFWGVKPAFLKQLAIHGYTHFNIEELGLLWRYKIPLNYLIGFAFYGYNYFQAEDYQTFYSLYIDPESLSDLVEQGLYFLSSEDLIRRTRHGAGRYLLS